ncbi:MAG: hypothetical protein KF764_34155 [Labilithrix sp.]|nr:hypothetical protein [Labilithrix sp.]MBX3219941.1 hypothetical protein [Labilithrix sp.]
MYETRERGIMSTSLTWRGPERRWRPRALVARIAGALAWVLSGLIAVAVYSNVIADDSELRLRIESLARETGQCGDGCRITSVQVRRSVLDYRADLELDGTRSVHVVCRRPAIALGEPRCGAQTAD